MARIPDIGNLTEEQTQELAATCLGMLDLSGRIYVVLRAFDDDDDRAELLSWLDTTASLE
jgi:hypothetical protein